MLITTVKSLIGIFLRYLFKHFIFKRSMTTSSFSHFVFSYFSLTVSKVYLLSPFFFQCNAPQQNTPLLGINGYIVTLF